MNILTQEQIRQLNMYSVYARKAEKHLFSFADLQQDENLERIIQTVQTISESPNETVAASFFLRRFGLFISMQFYSLAMYEEIWWGAPNDLVFGETTEYDLQTVSLYVEGNDWEFIDEDEHSTAIHFILHELCHPFIQQVKKVVNIASLTLWENIFGYLLWHYHVLLENPATEQLARKDLTLLKDDDMWHGISNRSLFANYLKGSEPSLLLNTPVRTTCCFSKDVPGLMQCGFCPLK